MQTAPLPPLPPLPPEIITIPAPVIMTGDDIAKIVAASMIGLAVVIWVIARGPIGIAIGAAIRKIAGVDQPTALPSEVDAVRAGLDQMRRQLGELAERQDFAERLLAQVRRERLPNPTDVPG